MGNGALPHGPSDRAHPRLYLSGHANDAEQCLLSSAKRTCHKDGVRSAYDPKWTSNEILATLLDRRTGLTAAYFLPWGY
jgi:hypothetical protein